MMRSISFYLTAIFLLTAGAFGQAKPSTGTDCSALPDHGRLKSVLEQVVKEGAKKHGGLGNQEWAVVVNRDGIVCAVVFSGTQRGQQWPGSRLIAAEKAHTVNALSTSDFALSTANLYAAAQPGGSLFSLVSSGPPNPQAAFAGPPTAFGQTNDPMVGKPIGGVIVFAGGLALYDSKGQIVGGLGLSGDTSCADHVMAWEVRNQLHLDSVPMGVSPTKDDNMIMDFSGGTSPSGFGHPDCKGGLPSAEHIKNLASDFPIGGKK
jgi:uncharacterized protein GlcG (DUF336 family)